ncbi:MAG: hypothetical protein IJC84_04760 [Clostridia bacterium]|nr:hypothetical protein [Clostridia bacterium]
MKRTLCLILATCLLFSLISCASESLETTETVTKESTPPVTEPKTEGPEPETVPMICDPLTWDDINAIPIANASMSTDELRQICVDFMALQLSFPWQTNKAQEFGHIAIQTSLDPTAKLEVNAAYGGMPYCHSTWSNLYQVMYFYDSETGVVDAKAMGDKFTTYMGNHCTSSSFWAWARVSNTNNWDGISLLMESRGAIRLGDYEIEPTTDYYLTRTDTVVECDKNGEQRMYRCYALLQKADGINYNHNATGGHVEMATQNAVVKYNPDGTINGEESYCYFQDQNPVRNPASKAQQADGTPIAVMSGVEHKYTFKQLYKTGYLPFTLAEFHGLDPVEKGEVSFTLSDRTTLSVKEFMTGKFEANYAISDVNVTFFDKDGKQTGAQPYLMANAKGMRNLTLSASVFGPQAIMARNIPGEGATMKVDVRISTGEVFTVYQGGITK